MSRLFVENRTWIFTRRKEMAGLFGLSINPEVYEDDFKQDALLGTFYQQNLGEEWCGLSCFNGEEIKSKSEEGLFWPAFSRKMGEFKGTELIGFCGGAAEPFQINSKLGEFSICFSGNIINSKELAGEFMDFGHTFQGRGDIEIIAKLIIQGTDMADGIKKMANKVKGAYSLLILTKQGIFAACSSKGHWPLVVAEKKGAIAVASESIGFKNMGFSLRGEIGPGEAILLRNGECSAEYSGLEVENDQVCSFLWVYTAFPNALIRGIPASVVRERLGATLARRDIENGFIPDIVSPVPDSGRSHSIGYFQEFCEQMMAGNIDRIPLYKEVLFKFPFAGRSFTPQSARIRKFKAHIKILTSVEDFTDKIVVINDDSIVRGTQTQTDLVPKLVSIGFREIHFRISNPELLSHCLYGKTTKPGELLAAKIPSVRERIEFLGKTKEPEKNKVKSLMYNTVDDLVKAIGLSRDKLCVDCSLPVKE